MSAGQATLAVKDGSGGLPCYTRGCPHRIRRLCRLRVRDPVSVEEPLAEPIAVAAHLLVELDEVGRVGVCARLLAILDGGRPLPVRVAVQPSAKVSCALGIHRVPLKGSGGSSPSSSYPPLTCAFPVSTAVMEPDAESSVAWILPVPWSLEYAPVPFFNTKRPFISEVVALVGLMPPLN